VESERLQTVLVINTKGGAGKTTLSTNLAGYFASQGKQTVLKDYDPQASSADWLSHRPHNRPVIHGINIGRNTGVATRSWQMRLPTNTQRVVVDCPAGADLHTLRNEFSKADVVLIPVMPSPIDIRASALFIHDLQKHLRMCSSRARIAAVASRVSDGCRAYEALVRIFENLDIPLVASFKESNNYMQAAEHGLSVMEMDIGSAGEDQLRWQPLLSWLEGGSLPKKAPKPLAAAPRLVAKALIGRILTF
jgi:chromosome partitioning protein